MRYLIQHPEPIGIERDLLTTGDVVEVAKAVEAAGWDGLAFTEHPAPGYAARDCKTWLVGKGRDCADGQTHEILLPTRRVRHG